MGKVVSRRRINHTRIMGEVERRDLMVLAAKRLRFDPVSYRAVDCSERLAEWFKRRNVEPIMMVATWRRWLDTGRVGA